eukprot:2018510-Pleurochrysis_carterae.AAC.10
MPCEPRAPRCQDVWDELPWTLQSQREALRQHLDRHARLGRPFREPSTHYSRRLPFSDEGAMRHVGVSMCFRRARGASICRFAAFSAMASLLCCALKSFLRVRVHNEGLRLRNRRKYACRRLRRGWLLVTANQAEKRMPRRRHKEHYAPFLKQRR